LLPRNVFIGSSTTYECAHALDGFVARLLSCPRFGRLHAIFLVGQRAAAGSHANAAGNGGLLSTSLVRAMRARLFLFAARNRADVV
jgi:hypothetical protein